jgi:hypothetical protein
LATVIFSDQPSFFMARMTPELPGVGWNKQGKMVPTMLLSPFRFFRASGNRPDSWRVDIEISLGRVGYTATFDLDKAFSSRGDSSFFHNSPLHPYPRRDFTDQPGIPVVTAF